MIRRASTYSWVPRRRWQPAARGATLTGREERAPNSSWWPHALIETATLRHVSSKARQLNIDHHRVEVPPAHHVPCCGAQMLVPDTSSEVLETHEERHRSVLVREEVDAIVVLMLTR